MNAMLKYSIAGDDSPFSPSHRNDNQETPQGYLKDTLDNNNNPRTRTKMVMKKRAKHVQKRNSDYSMLPPIAGPQNYRKDIMTPYINNGTQHELESPYTNALGISRIHDVSTPYIMNSHFSKMEAVSPLPSREYMMNGREYTKVATGTNVVDVGRIRAEPTFTHETLAKLGSSPYIERKTSFERRNSNSKVLTEKIEYERNGKLQVSSNQMGLLERRRQRGNETFSIRKKIEQFRRWHEEQYKEKLKKLKEDIDNQFEAEPRPKTKRSPKTKKLTSNEKYASIENGDNNEKENHPKAEKDRKLVQKDSVTSPEETISHSDKQPMDVQESVENQTDDKSVSEQTWHTWRDVNDSYAYNDVNKYIVDNELMNSEKSEWIHDWIIDVEKALGEPDEEVDDLL